MSLALIFSGQGAQKVGMGKSLADNAATAARIYARANEVLGWDLAKMCFEGPDELLVPTRVCQPALFVHGYTLYSLLQEQGRLANLTTVAGLSLGEVTALTVAGVFDFDTGLRVVAERGRLMQVACEATRGGMASIIGEDLAKISDLCQEFDIEVANLNCPGQVVVSGERTKVDACVTAAKERGMKKVIPLNVAGAYHSRLMEPARAEFAQFLQTVPFNAPKLQVLTNVTGKQVTEPAVIREMLVKQVVSSVRWEDCMREAAVLGVTEFWECGPGAVLAGLARRINKDWPTRTFNEYADLAAV
ncbi:MAG TPA: ACP S-malonyltransferase [Opitutaceae bacterium]|nr:ACP S-malonyltransferase [Opitutaceae bacterium]